MKKNLKKCLFSGLILFLLVCYGIFAIQDVIVSPVLCYKSTGTIDLERTFLGFDCECKRVGTGNGECFLIATRELPAENFLGLFCCVDIPVSCNLNVGAVTRFMEFAGHSSLSQVNIPPEVEIKSLLNENILSVSDKQAFDKPDVSHFLKIHFNVFLC